MPLSKPPPQGELHGAELNRLTRSGDYGIWLPLSNNQALLIPVEFPNLSWTVGSQPDIRSHTAWRHTKGHRHPKKAVDYDNQIFGQRKEENKDLDVRLIYWANYNNQAHNAGKTTESTNQATKTSLLRFLVYIPLLLSRATFVLAP